MTKPLTKYTIPELKWESTMPDPDGYRLWTANVLEYEYAIRRMSVGGPLVIRVHCRELSENISNHQFRSVTRAKEFAQADWIERLETVLKKVPNDKVPKEASRHRSPSVVQKRRSSGGRG